MSEEKLYFDVMTHHFYSIFASQQFPARTFSSLEEEVRYGSQMKLCISRILPFLDCKIKLLAFFVSELTPVSPIKEEDLVLALKRTDIGFDIEPLVCIARKTAEASVYSHHFFLFLIYLPFPFESASKAVFQSKVFLAIFRELKEDEIGGIYQNVDVGFSLNMNVLKYCSQSMQEQEMLTKMREQDAADLLAGLPPKEREPFWPIVQNKVAPHWDKTALIFILLKYGMNIPRHVKISHEDLLRSLLWDARSHMNDFHFGSAEFGNKPTLDNITTLRMINLMMRHPVEGKLTFGDSSVVERIREITPQGEKGCKWFVGTKYIHPLPHHDFDKKRNKNLTFFSFTSTLHFQHKSLEEWRYEDYMGKESVIEANTLECAGPMESNPYLDPPKEKRTTSEHYTEELEGIFEEFEPSMKSDIPTLMEKYHGKEYLLYMQMCKKYGVYPESFHCNPRELGTKPSELRFAWLHVQAELFDPSVYWFSNEEIQREMLLAMLQDECQEAFTFYRKMLDSLLDLDDTVVSQVICEFLIPYITETKHCIYATSHHLTKGVQPGDYKALLERAKEFYNSSYPHPAPPSGTTNKLKEFSDYFEFVRFNCKQPDSNAFGLRVQSEFHGIVPPHPGVIPYGRNDEPTVQSCLNSPCYVLGCHKTASVICLGCNKISYCSEECAREDWIRHINVPDHCILKESMLPTGARSMHELTRNFVIHMERDTEKGAADDQPRRRRRGMFDNDNQNDGGLFGNNNNNDVFGNSNTGYLIGDNNSGLFGNNNDDNSGGLFGNMDNSGGLFGNNNNNNSGGLFGGNNNNNSGGLFGNNNNNSGGLFGNNNNSGGLFGNNNGRVGLFDTNNVERPLFGSANIGLFGNSDDNADGETSLFQPFGAQPSFSSFQSNIDAADLSHLFPNDNNDTATSDTSTTAVADSSNDEEPPANAISFDFSSVTNSRNSTQDHEPQGDNTQDDVTDALSSTNGISPNSSAPI